MNLALFIGLQGSGKSTFAHRHLGDTHVRISRDVVRTVHRERALQYACFAAQQSFVADNTHPDVASRAPLIAAARAAGFKVVAWYFPPDLPAALEHNAGREGRARVPEVALHATLKRLELPTWAEGFDQIFHVHLVDGEFQVEEVARDG